MTDTAEKPVDEQVLAGTDETSPKPDTTKARAADGKFAKPGQGDEEKALDSAFKKHLGRDPQPEAAPKVEGQQPEKAKSTGTPIPKALELDGFTADDLQGLSPERIAALAEKASKRQADIDKKLSEKSKTADSATAAPEPAKTEAVKAGAQQMKELVKGVSELLGDDVGDALGKVIENAMKPLVERLEKAESFTERQAQSVLESRVIAVRDELAGEFPQLKDEAVLKRVVGQMEDLANPQKYPELRDLMRAAARLELFDELLAAKTTTQPKHDTSRQKHQPTAPTRASAPTASKTLSQQEDEALDAVFTKHLGR